MKYNRKKTRPTFHVWNVNVIHVLVTLLVKQELLIHKMVDMAQVAFVANRWIKMVVIENTRVTNTIHKTNIILMRRSP